MHLIARILNLKNRYQSLREFECTLIDLSGEKMKLSGKTYNNNNMFICIALITQIGSTALYIVCIMFKS